MAESKGAKQRWFATIAWEESAKTGWREELERRGYSFYVSPIHDSDHHEDGTPIKPHYHIMFVFKGNRTEEQMRQLFQEFGFAGLEKVGDAQGYCYYMCVHNQEGKVAYDPSNAETHGRITPVLEYIMSKGDMEKDAFDIIEFIETHDVRYYYNLVLYCKKYKRTWLYVLKDQHWGAIIINCIKSYSMMCKETGLSATGMADIWAEEEGMKTRM